MEKNSWKASSRSVGHDSRIFISLFARACT